MQVQDLVGIVPWTFVATILNLFIQVYLIKRFLFKPINEILEKRKAHADAEIQDATKAKEEAQAMKAEYEENMQNAKNKASEILTTAQKTAAIQSEEMLREASRQAAALKEKAEADIVQEKRKAVNELKDEIGGMAMEIAGKVIEREVNEKDHAKLIDDFISQVDQTGSPADTDRNAGDSKGFVIGEHVKYHKRNACARNQNKNNRMVNKSCNFLCFSRGKSMINRRTAVKNNHSDAENYRADYVTYIMRSRKQNSGCSRSENNSDKVRYRVCFVLFFSIIRQADIFQNHVDFSSVYFILLSRRLNFMQRRCMRDAVQPAAIS